MKLRFEHIVTLFIFFAMSQSWNKPSEDIYWYLPKTVLAGTDSLLSQKETCERITVIMHGR